MPPTTETPDAVECPTRTRWFPETGGARRPSRSGLLTRAEETDLIRRAQAGDAAAKQELVTRNEGLVVQLAKRFYDVVNFPFEDAFQWGNIGLLTAIDKFDLSSGHKLSTYATHWIVQAIGRGRHGTEDLIRLPSHVKEAQAKVRRARSRLLTALGREPTTEELAAAAKLTVREVTMLKDVPSGWLSLEAPAHAGNGTADNTFLVDFIADPVPGPDSDVRLAEFDLKQMVRGIFALADAETRDLLFRRFGFPPYDHPQSFGEVGKALGVSRQCVEQREKRALRRLRHLLGMDDAERQSRQALEDRNRSIVAAVQAGEPVQTVALRFNLQVRRVRMIVKQAGLYL